jgi:long-chain fatty acid transport protein
MKSRLFNTLATIGVFTALCLHTTTAEAVFASVKSVGMGGTAISYPLDSFAGAYNVAGLPDVGDRIDMEAAWVHDDGHADITYTGESPLGPFVIDEHFKGMRTKSIFPANFGFNKNWDLGCGCEDWVISTGAIFYNREYQKTTYNKPLPLLGTTNAGLEFLNETISAIIGVQWCKAHTIAISADYQFERIKVNGLQNFDRIPFTIDPGSVTNRGYGWASGWGLSVGYLGHWTECLSVGFNFSPKVTMSKIHRYKGFLAGGRLDVPQRIGVGVSYKILPCLVVAFDAEHLQWSKVRALHNPLLFEGIALLPLGSENGPGFGFRDQWFYRAGVEWTINECFVARVGFRHANTPVRESQTAVNTLTLDTVENYVTAGGTYNFNECNEFSVVGAYGFENSVNGKGAIPGFLLPQFVNRGDVKLTEQKFVIGLAWSYKY